jgi:hypothetical protein
MFAKIVTGGPPREERPPRGGNIVPSMDAATTCKDAGLAHNSYCGPAAPDRAPALLLTQRPKRQGQPGLQFLYLPAG